MGSAPDAVLCLAHLRWRGTYQRPQHLLSRCARTHRVVFFEEPMHDTRDPEIEITDTCCGVLTVVPHLPSSCTGELQEPTLRKMLDVVLAELGCRQPLLWYYTPMALGFTDHLNPTAVVYDCMEELSLRHAVSPQLLEREQQLFERCDVVFTAGHSLYEHKRSCHRNIHPFPSSVEVAHFAQARVLVADPIDQSWIPHPRVGYFGVIDERLNLELVRELAEKRPDLQIVMIGPVMEIDVATRPQRPNIHWLGSRPYAELPRYLAGWDVAMMPFAINEATRFLSPTKLPAYLAAGKPAVSTSIRDAVDTYGLQGLAWIADTAAELSHAIDHAMASDPIARLARADAFLADVSWDRTWAEMWTHVERVLHSPAPHHAHSAAGAGTLRQAHAKRER